MMSVIRVSPVCLMIMLLSVKLVTNRWAWELVPERLAGSRIHKQRGRYPWQPWKREPPPKAAVNWHRHSEWISGNNLPDLLYLPWDQQPTGREGGSRIRKDSQKHTAKLMIRNDQLAAQRVQCNKSQKPCKSLVQISSAALQVTYGEGVNHVLHWFEFNFA